MAKNSKSLSRCVAAALVVLMIVFQEISICAEGRRLKSKKCSKDKQGGSAQMPPPTHRNVDEFRPTAPGHSPGIGHSLHP